MGTFWFVDDCLMVPMIVWELYIIAFFGWVFDGFRWGDKKLLSQGYSWRICFHNAWILIVAHHPSDVLFFLWLSFRFSHHCISQVKVHQRSSSGFEILRMSLSSLHGGFLKPKLLREIPDPVTGYPLRWEAADGAQSAITDHPHVVDHVQLSGSFVVVSAGACLLPRNYKGNQKCGGVDPTQDQNR